MDIDKIAPICGFPTTIAFVDDNKRYLSKTTIKLDKHNAVYKCLSDAKEACEYLEKHAAYPEFLQRCISHEIDPARFHRNIDINILPIREEFYNPHRFAVVSVLLIDQEMPSLKGLEICERFKNAPFKKILLTGEVDDKQAIEAFNRGVIDQYVPKNADNFYTTINNAIAEQQQAYMQEATAAISLGLVQPREGYEPSILSDEEFIKVFDKIIKNNKICEFYLSEDNGSYVLFDATGKPSWLAVKDLDEMESDFYMAEDSPEPPTQDIIKGLEQRKLLVHMFTREEDVLPAKDWESRGIVYPAKELHGQQQSYYYAYIDKPDAHALQHDKITSFREYEAQAGGA
jgi:CheY-like chemotaxis protein